MGVQNIFSLLQPINSIKGCKWITNFTLALSILMLFSFNIDTYGVIYISSISELQKIGRDPGYPLNGQYELTQDIDASDTINWNGGRGFAPIGDFSNPFNGNFNGKNYVIRNLYINRASSFCVGLFGYVGTSGVIQNLKIENAYICGENSVGGVVGENKGTVTRVCFVGSVVGTFAVGGTVGYNQGSLRLSYSTGEVNGRESVGGLVGHNYSTGTVSQCYSMAHVLGDFCVGGLVGRNYGSITETFSAGRVIGVSISPLMGGLIGDGTGSVNKSYWDIESSGQQVSAGGVGKTTIEMKSKNTYVGWDFLNTWNIQEGVSYPWIIVLGETVNFPPVYREIYDIYDLARIGRDWNYPWNGNYILMADIDAFVTVNWNEGKGFEPITPFTGVLNGNNHKISNLFINLPTQNKVGLFGVSFGDISDLKMENTTISGSSKVGGLIGSNCGNVRNCYSSGNVTGGYDIGGLIGENIGYVFNCSSNCNITGDSYLGGLVGENFHGNISNSYFIGEVIGNSEYIGGITGDNEGVLSQNYSDGLVTGVQFVGGITGSHEYGVIDNCYSIMSVRGENYIGGLVGYNDETITQTYSAGYVEGTGVDVGGLVGANKGVVTQSYWDIETSNQNSSNGGEGKTTAEMKRQSTFVGWDFVNIWGMRENFTYPLLRNLDFPILTLLGGSEIIVNCGSEYIDEGAVAIDGIDGDLTETIQIENNVNSLIPGTYFVNFSVVDSEGHFTSVSRTVHVVDQTPPTITLLGNNPMYIECHTPFNDPGAVVEDECDPDVSVTRTGVVDVDTLGEYILTYTSVDKYGNVGQEIRIVRVIDSIPPQIGIRGDSEMTVECKESFTDPGIAYVIDACDMDVSVVVDGSVDTNVPNNYVIVYRAMDDSGNIGEVQRIVRVVDTIPPTVILNGPETVEINQGEEFVDPGVSVWDSCSSNVSLSVRGSVNTSVPDTYILTYLATDSSGNISQVNRTVIVKGISEGEGFLEGEGSIEGEGSPEGLEGEGETPRTIHSADQDENGQISISELLRVIQFFNMGGYHCALPGEVSEDGYIPGYEGDKNCPPHSSDYSPQDWTISLNELLRLIQFFNMGGYYYCPGTEDNFCPGTPGL